MQTWWEQFVNDKIKNIPKCLEINFAIGPKNKLESSLA
jgi:hypothetical protein